ncbi:uncharacterized protein V6R79_010810 [Siganus canaliculatus]
MLGILPSSALHWISEHDCIMHQASEVPCRDETPPASLSSMNPLDQGSKACGSECVPDTQSTLIQDIPKDNIKTEDASDESDMEISDCLNDRTSDQSPSTAEDSEEEDSEEEDSHDDEQDGGRDLASLRMEVWQRNSAMILNDEDDECEDVLGAAAPNLQPLEQNNGVCRPKQRLFLQHSTDEDQEQEQDFCRICHSSECCPDNLLLSPCQCSGSLRFIHVDCLQTWLRTRVESGLRFCSVRKCELCLGELNLDNSEFRLSDFYKPQSAFGFLEEGFSLLSWEMWTDLHPTTIIFPGFPRRAVRRSRGQRRRERRSSTPYSPPLTRS